MPGQSFDLINRQMNRAKQIADDALKAPEGEKLALKAISPDMLSAASKYISSDDLVKETERALAKEKGEAELAIKPLAKFYDEMLPIVAVKAGFSEGASSTFKITDDFVAAAEDMENALEENKEEEWAKPAHQKIGELLDTASKEYTDHVTVKRNLQKTQQSRVEAAEESRRVLIPFRQVVRSTFGRKSKEYRDLLDRRHPTSDEEQTEKTDQTDQTPTTPTTPATEPTKNPK